MRGKNLKLNVTNNLYGYVDLDLQCHFYRQPCNAIFKVSCFDKLFLGTLKHYKHIYIRYSLFFHTRYSRQYSKATRHWTFRNVKEPKSYAYMPELMVKVLNRFCMYNKEQPLKSKAQWGVDDPRRVQTHLAPSSPMPTKELVLAKKARISK